MSSPSGRVYDVSMPLRDGGLIYPGDPEIRARAHSSIALGDPANVSALGLGSHSGTHVDAPSHFIAGGDPVDRIAIGRLVGPAIVLDLPGAPPAVGARSWRPTTCTGSAGCCSRPGIRRGPGAPDSPVTTARWRRTAPSTWRTSPSTTCCWVAGGGYPY